MLSLPELLLQTRFWGVRPSRGSPQAAVGVELPKVAEVEPWGPVTLSS